MEADSSILEENILYLEEADGEGVDRAPYVFHDINALAAAINARGAETDNPITVYIAPGVYWVDDPEAVDTVQCREGDAMPFGIKVACDTLRLVGLSRKPQEVVLAGNRGQSHGANGNYTMFSFVVRELQMENITLGNYCSVDLEYPLKPERSHARRTNAITQAQLAWQQGDKLLARNCRFVSRLNLMPVCGGERCLYENCHFESTDDALNGRAVYLNCDFDFYGSRPFYRTVGAGAVFLHCLFRSRALGACGEGTQYFTKEGGQVAVVDCEYEYLGKARAGEKAALPVGKGVGWTKYPLPSLKCYQSNVRCLGESVIIGGREASETVCMEEKEIERAYRLEAEGMPVYNIYNLLRGGDEWDPMQIKDVVRRAKGEAIPTRLTLNASGEEVVAKEASVTLRAEAFYFYGGRAETSISFSIVARSEGTGAYVQLTDKGDGSCVVECRDGDFKAGRIMVRAVSSQGLEAALELKVSPGLLEAPRFVESPRVSLEAGVARVNYRLALQGYQEQSQISWYRSKNADGRDAVLVAVSKDGVGLAEYPLVEGDAGYYLVAQVEPAHERSRRGAGVRAVSESVVEISRGGHPVEQNFLTLPTVAQRRILPGFWTVDECRPLDTAHFGKWETKALPGHSSMEEEPWAYGETGNGSRGRGLYQRVQGARLLYTPPEGNYGDMSLSVSMDPAKTAGQGFGSADQYMDLCVKLDTRTLTGYGLRILRSREASDGVRFLLVEYQNGNTSCLNEGVLASCFVTGCRVEVGVKAGMLFAHAEADALQKGQLSGKYAAVVDMAVRIQENPFGGVAIWHTGTPGTGGWQNTTMLHQLRISRG